MRLRPPGLLQLLHRDRPPDKNENHSSVGRRVYVGGLFLSPRVQVGEVVNIARTRLIDGRRSGEIKVGRLVRQGGARDRHEDPAHSTFCPMPAVAAAQSSRAPVWRTA
jgi:hypothetical protein